MKVISASQHHLPKILEIISHAQQYLAQLNIDQWQNGYPNADKISSDITSKSSYLLINEEDQILATCMFSTEKEVTYANIEGEWLTSENEKYGVIHRMAVHNDFRKTGAGQFFFKYFEQEVKKLGLVSMRIDTHPDNLGMQNLMKLFNYTYCGVIYVEDGTKRYAYEKILIDEEEVNRQTIATWNNLADAYAEKFNDLSIYDDSYRAFTDLLSQNSKVLELACGTGVITKKLLEYRPDLDILATDASLNMIEKVKNLEVQTQLLDVRALHQHNNTYDAIIAGFVLPYISHEERLSFFQNVFDRLKSNAFLYLSFIPSQENQTKILGSEIKGRMAQYKQAKQEPVKQLQELGFEIIHSLDVDYSVSDSLQEKHAIIIAIKP